MPVLAMTYDTTGTLVATGSSDRVIKVWDIEKGFCTHSFRGHSDIIQLVKFHPNSNQNMLFSTSDDNTIKVWDLIDSKDVATFDQHLSTPKAIVLSPDGYMLVSSGMDKVMSLL